MDVTKTAPHVKLADAFAQRVAQHLPQGSHVCVGLSGGMDSIVLLHLFADLRALYSLQLAALHVHHGLSAYADRWSEFCQALCHDLGIPLTIRQVSIARNSESGIEAAARQARYRIFAEQDADFLALAHHRDDQAETLLLQLLRGAGVKGLAAMPVLRRLPGHTIQLFRPLLETPRDELRAFATQRKLHWVEDDSNTDVRYARNFLRHRILPLIGQHFGAWRTTLARSAQHLGEAALLLDELAQLDGEGAMRPSQIDYSRLASLSPARARNLLRHFLDRNEQPMPNRDQLDDMLRQLLDARADAQIDIRLGQSSLRRHDGRIWLVSRHEPLDPARSWNWQGETVLELSNPHGRLDFSTQTGIGLAISRLGQVQILLRQGGEHFQPDCRRPKRTLKALLQEARIPPWQRERLPLIYSDEELVAVPGLGIACDRQATGNEPGLGVRWIEYDRLRYPSREQ